MYNHNDSLTCTFSTTGNILYYDLIHNKNKNNLATISFQTLVPFSL